ncbi:TPA: glycerophosphodiester phosphodiesterase [Candidatus Poribacteria bacterium]|nr:glycerophosphodiester phosphodiesterase [Candidatus Poribacteria bacterium]
MRTRPLVIAHRGNSGVAPANTLIALRQAIELGVDMIEIDVNLTKDGVPVLIHDKGVDNTTNGKGLVSSFTLAELKRLDAGSWKDEKFAGERILTLAEALDCAKGHVHLAVDLKDESAIPAMVKVIRDTDMKDDVVICGCDVPMAQKVRRFDDQLTIVLNVNSELNKLAEREDKLEFIREYVRQACYAHLSALNVSYKYVNEGLIKQAHLRALPVWTWTVDDEEEMRRLIDMGVDAIYTNWSERLLKILS